jgi:hypothetical protein
MPPAISWRGHKNEERIEDLILIRLVFICEQVWVFRCEHVWVFRCVRVFICEHVWVFRCVRVFIYVNTYGCLDV